MELGYRLTITDSVGNEIYLSSMKNDTNANGRAGDIIAASYKSNTINDEALSRSNDVRAEIKVRGRISEENKEDTCKLALWSKEDNSQLIYRNVKLDIYTATDDGANKLRSYEIANMFVLDYSEEFTNTDAKLNNEETIGYFDMYIVQKKGNYSQYIETN